MKKCVLVSLFFFMIFSIKTTKAEVKFSGIGSYLGTNFLIGDSPVELSRLSPNLGIYSIYDLSPNLSLKFQIGYSKLITETTKKQFQTTSLPIEFSGLYNLESNLNITPLFHIGIGVMSFSINGSPIYFDGLFSGGAGFESTINERFSFLILANLTYTTGDDFNGYNAGLKDGYFSFQTGLTYNPNNKNYERKMIHQKKNIIAQNNSNSDSSYFHNMKLKTLVTNLKNEIAKKNIEIDNLKSQLGKINLKLANFENRIKHTENENFVRNKNSIKNETKLLSKNKTVREKYNEALNYYDCKDYNKAIEAFNNLYNANPSHTLSSNFIYWVGESYWGLNDYHHAIEAFEEIKKYSKSNKLDDALLMVGLCYMKISDFYNAKINFEEIIEKFPDSEFTKKAEHYLETIKSKILT